MVTPRDTAKSKQNSEIQPREVIRSKIGSGPSRHVLPPKADIVDAAPITSNAILRKIVIAARAPILQHPGRRSGEETDRTTTKMDAVFAGLSPALTGSLSYRNAYRHYQVLAIKLTEESGIFATNVIQAKTTSFDYAERHS